MKLFELWATLGLDTKGFDTSVGRAKATFQSIASGANTAISGIATGAQKIVTTTGNALQTVGNVITIAGTAFTGLATKSLNLAGELEQNLGGSEQVFKRYASDIQAAGTTAFKNLGLSQTDYLQTANKIGALLQGSGFEIEESMKLTADVMQRAADVASIMGIDTAWAMESIAGAAKGNFTMMDNLGVAMNATSIEAYAMANGFKKSWTEMSNYEKESWAFRLFLDKTTYATGNYARENETLAGSLTTAKAALQNFMSGRGGVEDVIFSVQNAGNVILKNLQTLLPMLSTGIAQMVAGLAPQLPAFISTLLPSVIEGANTLIGGLFSVLPDLMIAMSNTIPQIQNGLSQLLEGMFGGMPQFIAAATTLFNGLVGGFMSLLPQISALAGEIAPALLSGFITYKASLLEVGLTILTSVMEGISNDLKSEDSQVKSTINDIVTKLGAFVVEQGPTLVTSGLDILVSLMDGLKNNTQTITDAVAAVVDAIITWILTPGNLDTLLTNAFHIVVAIADGILSAESLKEMADAAGALIDELIAGIWATVGSVVESIKNWWARVTGQVGTLTVETGVHVSNSGVTHGGASGSRFTASLASISNVVGGAGKYTYAASHATGLHSVPYDEYPAILHAGEAVLTRSQADAWRAGRSGNGAEAREIAAAIVSALQGVRVVNVTNLNGRELARELVPLIDEEQGNELSRRLALGY